MFFSITTAKVQNNLENRNKLFNFAFSFIEHMNESNKESYSHVLKYTSIFGGVQGLNMLVSLVRNKAAALLLGAGGMGLSTLMTSVQNFAAQCTNLGISFGSVPRLSACYEKGDAEGLAFSIQVTRLWSLIAAMLGFVFCIVISPLVDNLSFSWGNHTLHYAMLAVSVAMMAITGGEVAILKATRQLGSLAKIQTLMAVASLFISIPLYYYFYQSGVVPAIVLTAIATMMVTVVYSYRHYPLSLRFTRDMLKSGADMVKLGLAFVVAAAIGSASEMFVRSFLNVEGDMDDVGFYNVTYMLCITYAGVVFSSMDTDYFPRLSAVSKDIAKTNETVNKQMEVSLLILSPMLVALLSLLPILVPLLFSSAFLPMVATAQVAVLAMFFKVLTMPMAYITLARSRSVSYLFLETSYFVVLVISIVLGFRWWGIWGTGLALLIAHVIELGIVGGFAYWQYNYRVTRMVIRYWLIQLSIGIAAYTITLSLEGWPYWMTEAALTIVSTAYSVHVLRQKTHLWESLKRRFRI